MQQPANHQVAGVDQRDDDRKEDAQPPTSAEFRGAVEHTMEDRWAKGLLGVDHTVAVSLQVEYDADLTIVPDSRQQR